MVALNLDTTVIGLQGHPISAIAPGTGDVLVFDGTDWVPGAGGAGGSFVGADPPTAPADGDLWYDTGTENLMVWNGSAWVPSYNDNDPFMPLAGGTFTGPVSMAGNAVSNLQPVTLQQLNGAVVGFMPLTGGTFIGPVLMAGDAMVPLSPVTLEQLNNALAGLPPATVVSDTLPLNPESGQLWWNLDDAKLYLYDGEQWVVTVNTPDGGGGVDEADLLLYLPLAGGIMLGPITCSGDATEALNPVTLEQYDAGISAVNASIANVSAQLGNYLPLTGGTLSNPGNLGVDGIINVGPSGQYFLQDGNGYRVINYTAGWSDNWRIADGLREWIGNSAIIMTLDGGGNLTATGQIVTGSNVIGNNSVQSNGVYFQNNAGWFFTPQGVWCADIQTGAITCTNINTQGFNITTGTLNAGGDISTGGVYWLPGGLYIQNNADYIFLAGATTMTSAVVVGNNPGYSWSINAGYMATGPSVLANAFVESSDERGKTDITNSTIGLTEILQLQPVTFTRNDSEQVELGLIAQQVQGIIDEAVVEITPDPDNPAPNTATSVAVQDAIDSGGGPLLAIQYSSITAALINAVKELASRVSALEA